MVIYERNKETGKKQNNHPVELTIKKKLTI